MGLLLPWPAPRRLGSKQGAELGSVITFRTSSLPELERFAAVLQQWPSEIRTEDMRKCHC